MNNSPQKIASLINAERIDSVGELVSRYEKVERTISQRLDLLSKHDVPPDLRERVNKLNDEFRTNYTDVLKLDREVKDLNQSLAKYSRMFMPRRYAVAGYGSSQQIGDMLSTLYHNSGQKDSMKDDCA